MFPSETKLSSSKSSTSQIKETEEMGKLQMVWTVDQMKTWPISKWEIQKLLLGSGRQQL